jgi:CRISPR-associated protein Cmr1
MKITLKTLTPLWTGGVDGASNRVQETGVIGSLRWWYEVIVRGLGGYVGSPISDNPKERCEFDTDAYQKALRANRPQAEALAEGQKSLSAVTYLFGATGWARLFRLRSLNAPRIPLHFRTTTLINKNWLGRIFGGREDQGYSIDDLEVVYGELDFELTCRRHNEKYVQEQLTFLLRFVENYGSLGAKPQHGFGQIGEVSLPDEMAQATVQSGMQALQQRLTSGEWRTTGPAVDTPYNLNNFFHQTYKLSESVLYRFKKPSAHFGNADREEEEAYLPCAFDFRYKGAEGEHLGFRRWLKEEKGWQESDDPDQLGPLDKLMGPRSRWKNNRGHYVSINDELRTASRVCFGMPIQVEEGYHIVIFGFAPPQVISVDDLSALCQEYMQIFSASQVRQVLGRELLASHTTGGAA